MVGAEARTEVRGGFGLGVTWVRTLAFARAAGVFETTEPFLVDWTGLDAVLGAEPTDRCSEAVGFLPVTDDLTEEFLTDGVFGAIDVSDCFAPEKFNTDVSRCGVADFALVLDDFPGVSFCT